MPIVSMELSKTLMNCKSCGIGCLKTVPVRRGKHAPVASKCMHSNFLTDLAYIQLSCFFPIPTISVKHYRVVEWQQSMLRTIPVHVLLLANKFVWNNLLKNTKLMNHIYHVEKTSLIAILLVKLQVNTQRMSRKNIEGNLLLVLIA